MLDRWFLAHPRSVGESYGEHFGVATRFGLTMIAGGLAALVHGVFPKLFERTGSRLVRRLHDRMVARQPNLRAGWDRPEWQIEYEI